MPIHPIATLGQQIALRIVERISASVQKPIFVTDVAGTIIASSNGQSPSIVRKIAIQAIGDEAIAQETNGTGNLVGLPLVHGGRIAGAIVLDEVLAHNDEIVSMARTLAELIIHQMRVVDQLPHQAWAREKFLFDLLQGRLSETPDVTLQEAALLHFDLLLPRVVALVAIEAGQPGADRGNGIQSTLPVIETKLRSEQRESELLALMHSVLHAWKIDIACFLGNRWLALLPAIEPRFADLHRREFTADLQRFLDRITKEYQQRATAGVGRYYDGWPALTQSFADARFALEIGRDIHGPSQVYLPGQLGVASFVCSNDTLLKTQLAEHLVHRIVEEPDLLHTLDVFLEANLSPSVAAERLHIHRHTLAHRLDKIARFTGLDPRRFQELAQLHAALVLHRTCVHPDSLHDTH